jgi:hypothetical protein
MGYYEEDLNTSVSEEYSPRKNSIKKPDIKIKSSNTSFANKSTSHSKNIGSIDNSVYLASVGQY